MLIIDDDNNIILTRGDTLTLKATPKVKVDPVPPATEPTWEPYEPQEGDVIRFAISKGYKGEPGYELMLSKNVPLDTFTFTCSSQETSLKNGLYHHDVEITFADGTVDTYISGDLIITGEAK